MNLDRAKWIVYPVVALGLSYGLFAILPIFRFSNGCLANTRNDLELPDPSLCDSLQKEKAKSPQTPIWRTRQEPGCRVSIPLDCRMNGDRADTQHFLDLVQVSAEQRGDFMLAFHEICSDPRYGDKLIQVATDESFAKLQAKTESEAPSSLGSRMCRCVVDRAWRHGNWMGITGVDTGNCQRDSIYWTAPLYCRSHDMGYVAELALTMSVLALGVSAWRSRRSSSRSA
jgi:hypothetical protein